MSQERTFEIVNGWLVERCEGDQIDGYGILPGSDIVPHLDLSQIEGWMFSDEAIERAAKANFRRKTHNEWETLPESIKAVWRKDIRATVAALKGDA